MEGLEGLEGLFHNFSKTSSRFFLNKNIFLIKLTPSTLPTLPILPHPFRVIMLYKIIIEELKNNAYFDRFKQDIILSLGQGCGLWVVGCASRTAIHWKKNKK